MASINTLVSETVSKPHDELSEPSSIEASQQVGGDGDIPKPANPPEPNPAEDSKSNSTPANGTASGTAPEAEQEQANVGEKREIEATSTANTAEKPSSKKHKTNENHTDAANGTSATVRTDSNSASQTSTGKKKGGRPRKTKDSIPREISTDGIGSRTRSRTKVVS
ncbi:hypothetical protein BDW59DRAFT_167260 [Aspergillus cavernicola]|uniref:AT hook motif protein n=1 Tax=Aspergillus cavernicola TaxID=176166 RepID=A0ABR4HGE8_9EURO